MVYHALDHFVVSKSRLKRGVSYESARKAVPRKTVKLSNFVDRVVCPSDKIKDSDIAKCNSCVMYSSNV